MQRSRTHSTTRRPGAETATPVLRVLLASPDHAERLGLATIVSSHADMELTAQASTAEDAAALVLSQVPDVSVIDARLLSDVVRRAFRLLGKGTPRARLVALVMHPEDDDVARALQLRAQGIVLRGMYSAELVEAIRTVHRGGYYSSTGETAASPETE
jgi:DNA-binding NarL/FixJ family response regulator